MVCCVQLVAANSEANSANMKPALSSRTTATCPQHMGKEEVAHGLPEGSSEIGHHGPSATSRHAEHHPIERPVRQAKCHDIQSQAIQMNKRPQTTMLLMESPRPRRVAVLASKQSEPVHDKSAVGVVFHLLSQDCNLSPSPGEPKIEYLHAPVAARLGAVS